MTRPIVLAGWKAFLLAAIWFAAAVPQLFSQTADPKDGPQFPLTQMEVWNKIRMMNITVDMNEFQTPMTMEDALAKIYQQLGKKGIECPVVINWGAFLDANVELNLEAIPVKFAGLPRYIPLSRFLQEACRQIPKLGGNCAVHRDSIVIVPAKQAIFRWWVDRSGIRHIGGKVKRLQGPMV
jgi:hypothetical protein